MFSKNHLRPHHENCTSYYYQNTENSDNRDQIVRIDAFWSNVSLMSAHEGEGIAKDEEAKLYNEPSSNSTRNDTASDSLKSLADRLSDPALKSSARVVILISLSINKKLTFIELLELTGLGKGSLENHLDRLSNSQYVRTRNIKTFVGLREIAEITSKGEEVCRSIMTELRNVRDKERY